LNDLTAAAVPCQSAENKIIQIRCEEKINYAVTLLPYQNIAGSEDRFT
jgi:hypothetical protein